MNTWLIIILAGLLTYATRLSFILLLGRMAVPDWLQRALRFVPMAVLSAIIVPEAATRGGAIDLSPGNPQLWSAALAVLVAWRTRNILLTLLAGMAALLVGQQLLGH